MNCKIHQIFPVIERYDLHIRRQDILIQFVYFRFQPGYDFSRILSFAHHHNAFHYIIFIHTPHLAQTG